jgi:hypothetical protein
MINRFKNITQMPKAGERGYVYILVLVFLLIGALMIPVLLGYMGTGVKSGQIFERRTDELYAADAGIDDAIWQITYGKVYELDNPESYDPYDYTHEWPYELTDEVNDQTVSVAISNKWIPTNLAAPTSSKAQEIIDARKLMINGTKTGTSEYYIRISFLPENELERDSMIVTSIGIWLPSGYHYQDGSSNLEYWGYSDAPLVTNYGGGEVVIWDLGTVFDELPPEGSQETAIVDFEYTTDPNMTRELETISWITTTGGVVNADFAWDNDTKVYAIKSTASDTTVDSVVYQSSQYSAFIDNAITSLNDVYLAPGSYVQGNVQYNGDPGDSKFQGHIDGELKTDPIDWWPETGEWRDFFLDQVTNITDPPEDPPIPAPDPGYEIDLIDYAEGDSLGPFWRRDGTGDLDIDNTGDAITVKLAFGQVIYVTGDLSFKQPGGDKYIIDMNWGTIFVEGNIDFPPQRVGLMGSGCIIAIGDINFQPEMAAEPENYILVCSLEGFTWFKPQGNFYGSIAGATYCDMNPNSQLYWTPAPGGLNVPGFGGGSGGGGGFAHNLTKYTWKID